MSNLCLGCFEPIGNGQRVCPHCGYVAGQQPEDMTQMLPGTLFHDRYIIGKALGSGNFGITYLAWDPRLEQKVAIKEYLPFSLAAREPGQSTVSLLSDNSSTLFRNGMDKFLEEAKKLAKFQNEEGIVKFFDSFEENGTAYIVMEYLDGMTLEDYLKENGTINEDDAVDMLMPVMKSLQAVHGVGILHRDIAPDNIIITKRGEIKLIDFGAARMVAKTPSRSVTSMVKTGYSPEEQYHSHGEQGAYTDVYALSATLYKMITGVLPPDAMVRRAKYEKDSKDMLVAPHKYAKGLSASREVAILNALNVRPEDRTPDIATFIEELETKPHAKRRYGKIKKIDLYTWPLWLKILLPTAAGLLLLFGILLGTGVISFKSNYSNEIVVPDNMAVVPDVEGMASTDAVNEIESKNLIAVASGNIVSEYVVAGRIVLQSPPGGSYLDINGQVLLTVSSGSGEVIEAVDGISTVPYVLWDTKEDAIAKLEIAGLGAPELSEEYDDNIAEGLVISQSVAAGEQVDEGTSIALVISLGPKPFAMPDVIGMSETDAEKVLKEAGLFVVKEYGNDESVDPDKVFMQSIVAGNAVVRGTTVTITVCSRTATINVPDVAGLKADAAKKTLEDKGLSVNIIENYDENVESGYVISQTPEAGSAQLPGANVTLYVSKGAQTYNVSFDANGGSVSPSSKIVTYGREYGDLPVPERTGYYFGGWYTKAENGTPVSSSSVVSITADQTLYAQWSNNAYNVYFDANGGYVSLGSKQVAYGLSYGELPTPEREGYDFAGWYTAATNGSRVGNISTVNITSDQTLYAHWSAAEVRVSFDGNGGSVDTISKKVIFNSSYQTLPTPSRTGYTFDGWYTYAEGGERVTESTTVSNASDHSIYAHWKANPYKLSFNVNSSDGKASFGEKTIVFDESFGDLPTASRTGYGLVGWFTEASGGSPVSSATVLKEAADQTVYAHWEQGRVTVSFDGNGGTASESSRAVRFDDKYSTLPSASRTGYSFNGWYTAKSGGSRISESDVIKSTSDYVIYAQWTANRYTVEYDANGGSVTTTSKYVTYDSTYGTLPTPTRTGYSFNGWFTAPAGGNQISSDSRVAITSDQTIYAQWSANPYIVKFDANGQGASVSTASKSVTFDAAYGDLPTPTWTGYTFKGWYDSKSDGNEITTTSTVKTAGDHSIYAQWSANQYTVKFDANGKDASVSTTSKSVTYNSTYGELPTPTRTGYSFDDWYTSSSGGSKVTSSSTFSNTSDQTLYAHWSAKQYTVKFDANGGSVSKTSMSVTYNSSYGSLPNPTRTGYSFDGWYTSSSGGSKVTSSSTFSNTSDQTLYAHWSVNQYTYNITYKSVNGTILGTSTVTKDYGTTNTISPASYSGYTSPGSQTVKWDQTSAKAITFSYTPTAVQNAKHVDSLYESSWGVEDFFIREITVEYRNRKEKSIELRFITKITLKANCRNGYEVKFYAGTSEQYRTADTSIPAASTWGVVSSSARSAQSDAWVTVPVSGAGTSKLTVFHRLWTADRDPDSKISFEINIPKY